MMSFARWRKCDFQIHTPRDPNWTGDRPLGIGDTQGDNSQSATTDDVHRARAGWAIAFVDACVKRGLQAVALTDHHEMTMIPHVQAEIAQRVTADPTFDLWLFPGMELTCNGGKQCLILFDTDLSEDWHKQAQGKLGITYADLNEEAARGPAVRQLASSYPDVGPLLDELEGLRGKYIVLPNVSQGNSHTVLTDANHADFRRMSYVGGYLDHGQTIQTLSARNRRRLSGETPQWSEREIYPLPTSDSRSADYSRLGTNNTWVKLATPTAEAIRQAFLAQKSRISIEEPKLPPLIVARIHVAGATILSDSALSLSPELNAAIGGRGTGKSSFLEYLAFGLGRSSYDIQRNNYSGTERLAGLITDTLVSKNGTVQLTIVQDGAEFTVSRGPATGYQPEITYPNSTRQTITVKELRALFPATVYSQGELSEIGKQTGSKSQLSDLFQFVNPDYKREDDKLAAGIESAKSGARAAIERLTNYWAQISRLRKLTTSRDSLKQRIIALEKTLPKHSDDDQKKIDYFDKATDFDAKRLQASKHVERIIERLAEAKNEQGGRRDLDTTLADDASPIQERYGKLVEDFSTGIDRLEADIKIRRAELEEAEKAWATKFTAARTARDGVLEKLGEHKTVTGQIINLREELARIANDVADLEATLQGQGDPTTHLNEAIDTLRNLVDARAQRTKEWASEIEQLSSGKIKATVEPEGDISQIKDAVDYVAKKTGSQESTRLKQIEEALKIRPMWDWLDRLRRDCLALLYWQQVGAASGEESPKCDDLITLLGSSEKIRSALAEHMETTRVEAIAAAVPKPEITLLYRDGDREMSFEKASEGQRAGALLFMLLVQPGGPLIVDQPEGDLDNKVISELTDKLHLAKQKRQIIVASHNANIVVNGSAELVGHLEVRNDGMRQFDCAGAIDKPQICKLIADTMEGGEKAFRDRKDKYGY